jgi:hypothetical protein
MSDWRRFSRLPQSPAYWQELSTRVQQSVHTLGNGPAEPVRSLAPLAWMAIAACTVAVIASTMLPSGPETAVSLRTVLVPADPVAATWLEMPQPPSATQVLFMQMAISP